MNNKQKLFIVQEECYGIPEWPVVFLSEKQADNYFIELVFDKANCEDSDIEINTVEEAQAWVEDNCYDDWFCRYWVVEPEVEG